MLLSAVIVAIVVVAGLIFADCMISYVHFIGHEI
jgi:hypothetical protein